MQGKAPLPAMLASDHPVRRARELDDDLDAMWRLPADLPEKPKQLDSPTGLITVPVDSIEELDRSQRLLSSMIGLAMTVSRERLKTERASVNVRRLEGGGSSDDGGVAQWYELAEQVDEIASLSLPGKAGVFSKEVRESIERFQEAREGASRVVQEVLGQVTASGASSLGGSHGYAPRQAIVKLRGALERCASACDSESQHSLRQLEYTLRSFFERIEGQQGPSNKPTADKQPRVGLGRESDSPVGSDGGKSTGSDGDEDLKQPIER